MTGKRTCLSIKAKWRPRPPTLQQKKKGQGQGRAAAQNPGSSPGAGRKGPVKASCAAPWAFGLGTREGGLCKFAKEKEKRN